MPEQAYFEDFQVGDRVVTQARTITETDLVQFAALTGDWHPLHSDAEYAKSTIFGERIAHGLLILSISAGLMYQARGDLPLLKSAIALSGIERIRFVAATKIGDTIHLEGEVVNLTIIDSGRGMLTVNHRVKNQHGQQVLTYTTKVLVARRLQMAGGFDG
jgi:3-hydroxybutyryl-CoA dehydratase